MPSPAWNLLIWPRRLHLLATGCLAGAICILAAPGLAQHPILVSLQPTPSAPGRMALPESQTTLVPSPTAAFQPDDHPHNLEEAPAPESLDAATSDQFSIEVRAVTLVDLDPWEWLNRQIPGALELQSSPLPAVLPLATRSDANEPGDREFLLAHRSITRSSPTMTARLDKSQVDRLLSQARGDQRVNICRTPLMRVAANQVGLISDTSGRPFVIGLRPTGAGSMQPEVQIIEEGLKIRLQAEFVDNRIHLRGDLVNTQVTDVKTVTIPVPFPSNNESPPAIQVPEQRVDLAHFSIRLDDPEATILVAPHWPRTRRIPGEKKFWGSAPAKTVVEQPFFLIQAHRLPAGSADMAAAIPTAPREQTTVSDRPATNEPTIHR